MGYFGQPWGGAPVEAMRASHADRDRAVDVLKAAFAEGRLTKAEYEQRVELALRSATYGELGRLVADLPVGPLPAPMMFPAATRPLFPPAAPPAFLPPPAVPPAPRLNDLAALSLTCGVAGLAFVFPAVPAIVLGHKARSQIAAGGGSGERAATAGLVLGWLVVSLWTVALLVAGLA